MERELRQGGEAVEFRGLGPLEVRDRRSRVLKLAGRKQQGLLALLLLRPNETVATDTLVDWLWGEDPPESAANALQVYVSGLRKVLGHDVLLTTQGGYELHVDPEQIDLMRFERLVEDGRRALAGGDPEAGAEYLTKALELWRGRPLAGLGLGAMADAETARLEDLRLGAIEDRFEAEIELGRHTQVIGELEALVAEHPLRERLHTHLALALYRGGRQGDALDVYRSLRKRLVHELGLEPSPALQRLEQQILRQDPALELEPAPPVEAAVPARKPVTALAVAVQAATGTGAPLDPETEERVVSRLVRELLAVPERHGAAAEQIGSTLVALFGVPLVHEDDALRAARAGLELREPAAAGVRSAQEHGIKLSVRIGIASGESIVSAGASLAQIGGAILREADSLCRVAEAGEILVAPGTRALLGGAANAEAAGQTAWRLLGVAPDAEAIARRLDAGLVGRKRELARLRKALDEAIAERACVLVTVVGPAGIGKSRLVRELAARVEENATTVSARCLSYGEGITFLPLAEIVRQLAGDDVHAGLAKLMRGDRQGPLAVDRLAAALGSGEGETTPEQTCWAVRRLFEALARRRPLLVCLEDAHWADPALLDLVDYLVEWTRDAPLLLVVTGRPELLELRPAWEQGRPHAVLLSLEPLSEREVATLIRSVLDPTAVDESLRERIAAVAEGNPLFIEQMAAMLGDDLGDIARLSVPPTIQALLMARLDLLPPEERAVLERASVIGREFEVEPLAELVREIDREHVIASLESLWLKQLVDARPDGGFRFRHQLIAEVAYEAIPKTLRADLHERLADWIEAGDEGRPEYEEAVGYNLERAYRYREEVDPLSQSLLALGARAAALLASAGLRAAGRGNPSVAVAMLTRAAALPGRDAAASVELKLALAGALREIGDLAGSLQQVEEVTELAGRVGRRDLANEARVLGLRLKIRTDREFGIDALLETAGKAIVELEELDDARGLAEAWYMVAWGHWLQCDAAGTEEALEHAIPYARRISDDRALGSSVGLLLGAGLFGSLPASEAIRRCEDVLADEEVPLRVGTQAHRALGALLAMQGRFDEARAHLERDRQLIEEAGLRLALLVSLQTRGEIEMLAGDPVAAERWLRDGFDRAPAEEKSAYPTLAVRLAEALYQQGRLDEVLQLTEESERAAAPHDLSVQIQWRAARAKVLAARGAEDEARQLAAAAVELAAGTDFLLLQGDALLDAAEVMRLCGAKAEEADLLDRAAACFEQKGNVVSAAEARERRAARARRPLVTPKT
jgi:DNA-binding SARP family transcriptional activator